MKKVYKLTLVPILSFLMLYTLLFSACSNKQNTEDTKPTDPQTFETDTSRDINYEIVKHVRGNDSTRDFRYLTIYDESAFTETQIIIAQIQHSLTNNRLSISCYYTIGRQNLFISLEIPKNGHTNSSNFKIRTSLSGSKFFAKVPNFGVIMLDIVY